MFAPITATANEKQANALHKTEVRGISSLAPARLEDMITASVAASGVEFSTSWLDKQAVAKGDANWRCLSEALYFEARGETVKGQFAVAEVIMNRVAHSRFPSSLCDVINQGTGKNSNASSVIHVMVRPKMYLNRVLTHVFQKLRAL